MTRQELCDAARHTKCTYCGAEAGQACDCGSDLHYARVARALRLGWISLDDPGDRAAYEEAIGGGRITSGGMTLPAVTP